MKKRRKLLFSITKKDFKVQTFTSGGKGGQHQNRKKTGVRVTHPESGASGECRDKAPYSKNRAEAFRRCYNSERFQLWFRKEVARRQVNFAVLDEWVREQMQDEHLKIEYL